MKKVLLIALALPLGACGLHPEVQLVDSSCSWAKPIFIGKDDRLTTKTADEILAHDEKWKKFCGSLP